MAPYCPPMGEHETVIKAASRVIQAAHYSDPSDRHGDAEHEHSQELLALAARALTRAVDAKPADDQPIGWTPADAVADRPDPAADAVTAARGAALLEASDWVRDRSMEGYSWQEIATGLRHAADRATEQATTTAAPANATKEN